ncbi:MAG: hypothetical protein CVV04_10210 [Firmicutes bacterium HGW-Firmicutes-9]|jgi:hypothetical protein|nr:MAG: hypothetical protein CVV04_10210 [Firmicutes bacterium HGW-Firmicutes-9]
MLKDKWSRLENRIIAYSFLMFSVYLAIFVFFVYFWRGELRNLFSPFCVDFGLFYAAGKMTLAGNVAQIFDVQAHHAMTELVLNLTLPYFLPWLYPPFFLFVIVPLTMLPFDVALIVWLALTLEFMIVAARRMLPSHKKLAFLLVGFPGVFLNLRWGQNGFLSTALLGLSIAFMETSPVLSGVMVGLLAYKPQLAILPFFVLLIKKNWKAILSAFSTVISASILSLLIFGKEVWIGFFQSLFHTSSYLMETSKEVTSSIQPTLLTTLIDLGIDSRISLAVQMIVALCAVAVVSWAFLRSKRLTLKGIMLVLGMPLIIPYFMQYDLVILGLALVLLIYDFSVNGYTKLEGVMAALLWLMPLINSPVVLFTKIQLCPIVLIVEMVMIIKRINRENMLPAIQQKT